MTLSVCCVTDAPLELMAAAIAPLRPYADEVVIAVDSRLDPDVAAAHAGFADRVVRMPYVPPVERSFAWLHAQCTGDWILRIDSDEVASAALVARLPELIRSRAVTNYWIPRRWLFPDRSTYLAEWPWLPDYQLRLVRNEPALLHFPGTIHTSVACLGPALYLEEPIYHLDFVIRPEAERAEKAAVYNRHSQGISLAGKPGRGANEALYLPERRASVVTAEVPAPDHDLLAAEAGERFLLSVNGSTQGTPGMVTREEVDGYWSRRTFGAAAYAAELDVSDRTVSLPVGELRTLDVDVTNRGTETWEWGADATPPIQLSYELRTDAGRHVCWGPRTPMPARVPPGSTLRVPLLVRAPETAGTYVLAIDLVHEHVRWFDVAIEVTVRARPVPRVGIVAGYSPFRHVGDDAIVEAHVRQLTEHAPEAHVLLFGEAPAALNERFGTEAAPSIHTYLMEGLDPGAGNLALLRRWVPRTLSLLRAARRRRAQGESGTSRSAADRFLEDLERIDVLIAASAGGFTSRYRREVLWPHAVTALAAAALGRPVVFSGLTVGPFNGVSDRIVAGFALRRAAAVLPRDGSGSVRALRGLAVPRRLVEVTVDPAAALESASPGSTLAALGVREPYAVIAAHAGAGAEHATLRLAVEHLRARGIATVFVPMIIEGEHDDRVFGRELACDRVLDELPPDDVVKGMVGTACVAVGTRYHLVVFAAAQGVAALGLYGDAYGERKLVGLAEQAGAGVSALPLTTGREELTRTLDQLLQAGSGSVLPAPHPLPGVAVALPALKTP